MEAVFKSAIGEAAVLDAYRDILGSWPIETEQRFFDTCQGRTFVLTSGRADKPPLVLLHGSASNSSGWIADMPIWAEHFQVHAIDIIGEPGLSAASRPALVSGEYAAWLDDVFKCLGLQSSYLLGLSLGGWIALDFALRRKERVSKLVLISPGGVSRNRNILIWALPLLLLGRWGRKKMMERVGGVAMTAPDFAQGPIGRLSALIFQHFRPRTEMLPVPSDEHLARLAMPVMALLGGRDVFIHAAEARDRLVRNVPQLTMRYIAEGHHFLPGQAGEVTKFLRDER
jgi:pimeloyl-ACP methyl ester carboxylesterase